jgi:hypothetical protein
VVGQAVGLPRRTIPVEGHRALPVEVHRDLVRVQVVEHGRQRLPAMQIVGGVGPLAGHVDDEVRVFGEERLLPLGVTTIGAEGIGVDELADRQPVRGLFG